MLKKINVNLFIVISVINVLLFSSIVVLIVRSTPHVYASSECTGLNFCNNLGTADAVDGSNDAINFSQGRVWTIDKFGKYIWLTQNRNSTITHWAWSNDLGSNWTQGSENYGFFTRGSVAYDSKSDVFHVIWGASSGTDGIIYRRYKATRDGSNNITDIVRIDSAVNLVMDSSGSANLDQPVAIWVDDGSAKGSLVAVWSKHDVGFSDIRASMRHLSMDAADGVAGNWIPINNAADSFTAPPAVAANLIFHNATNFSAQASAFVRGGTGARKDDLYIFVADSLSKNLMEIRGIWSGSPNFDWRGGLQSPVTIDSGGIDPFNGYNIKQQLISKPVLDTTNDKIYLGWARWKSGGAGDTVSFVSLSSTDVVSAVTDVYSANGTHSYAPTFDIAYDNTGQNLYVTYIESTTNGDSGSIDYKTFNGTTLSSSTRFYTSPGGSAGADGSADIPILYENRSSNNRMLLAFRVNGALPPSFGDPHTIFWGYITLSSPTPTPTTTPPTTTVATTTASTTTATTTTAITTASTTTTSAPSGTPLSVSISDDNGGNVQPGDTLTQTVIMTNNTGVLVNSIDISTLVPDNASYVSGTIAYASGNAGSGGNFIDPQATSSNVLTGASLANGQSLIFSFKIRVSSSATSGTVLGISVGGNSSAGALPSAMATVNVLGALTNTGENILIGLFLGYSIVIALFFILKKNQIKQNKILQNVIEIKRKQK